MKFGLSLSQTIIKIGFKILWAYSYQLSNYRCMTFNKCTFDMHGCLNLDDECDVTGGTGEYSDYWNKVDLHRENRRGYHIISYIIHPDCMVRVSNPCGGKVSLSRPDGSETQPAPCKFGTGSFPGLKKPVRFPDRPPSSSVEVANGLELYVHLRSILA